MTHTQQITAFDNDILALINRYRREFDLPYASVIGTMQMRIMELYEDAGRQDNQE